MAEGAAFPLVVSWVWGNLVGSDLYLAAVLGAILLRFGGSLYGSFFLQGHSLRNETGGVRWHPAAR
jgi:hypothetical protein